MGEVRKGTPYLQGDAAGPLNSVYDMPTCAWSLREKACQHLMWTKNISSMCFKAESWWGWNTRRLIAEQRHEPGGKGICWSWTSANFFSLCGLGQFTWPDLQLLMKIPSLKESYLSRVLWEDWDRPHEKHIEMHYAYIRQVLQSRGSAAVRWKASETPFPMSWWSFPAGVQRLLPGLAQSVCWEKN